VPGESLSSRERLAALDALREIGELDSNEILLIEAAWTHGSEPWPALQRVAALWLYIVSVSSINPAQIFLHLQPGLEKYLEENFDYPSPQISVELLRRSHQEDSQEIALRLKNLAGEKQIQKGRMVLVADFPNRRVTSTGETLAPEQDPDPRKGRRFRFRRLINPTF